MLFLFVGYAEPEAEALLLLLLDELDDVGIGKSVGCATMGGLCDELLDETFTTECVENYGHSLQVKNARL